MEANNRPNDLGECHLKAAEIAKATLNAREYTIFELPSFRDSITKMRCLLLVDGFYEWRLRMARRFPITSGWPTKSLFNCHNGRQSPHGIYSQHQKANAHDV
ncbi:SOS response-associated peptidase [Larkinella terrae]|uniref:SOS response-associated peptidase n=1 Tax=Larkinella terrae TaxID=2025311 RepID=UPI0021D1E6E9|nr:SOS response-associated peptidase [Larkinella terrae]